MEEKMQYQLSTSVDEGIVKIVITGEVTATNVEKLQTEVIIAARSIDASALLVDVRLLKGRLGLGDTYFRVRSYPADTPKMKTAVVDVEENATFQVFHETTARNAGQSIKWFTDTDTAMLWLKNKEGDRDT